jgi:hypothetical protein
MDADKLIKLVHDIRSKYELIIKQSPQSLFKSVDELKNYISNTKKYEIITSKYNSMLAIILSNNYDAHRLEYMIKLASRVHKGEIDEHSASVAVGQELVDKIVKPQIEK